MIPSGVPVTGPLRHNTSWEEATLDEQGEPSMTGKHRIEIDSKTDTEYRRMGRRELLRIWGPPVLASLGLGAAAAFLHGRPGRHEGPAPSGGTPRPIDWRRRDAPPALAIGRDHGPVENLRRALGAIGGIGHFVSPGETVLVKPNCGWDRRPEQAANTDPELVAELVRQCFEAGAKRVVVADVTCHDPKRAFLRSGIGPAAKKAGAAVLHQNTAGTVSLDLGGTILGVWKVLRPLGEADRVINVPIVKHHSLSRATLGMKNWFGVLVGPRPRLHQRINQSIAELGAALRPTLTVVDATRVLTGGGPTGGSLDLVRDENAMAVSTDPVAADAWGASLLGLGPESLPFLGIAERLRLGTTDWKGIVVEA